MKVKNTMRRIVDVKILPIILFILTLLAINGVFLQSISAEEPDNLFTGDSKFLTYPYEQHDLKEAQVIISSDIVGKIEKVYHYTRKGQLDVIHLPLVNISLYIEKKNNTYQYIIVRNWKIYPVQGGNFDNLNIEYAGQGGIADTLIAEKYLKKIIKSTEHSISHIQTAVLRYEKRTGKKITMEEFNRPITTSHLLMSTPGMNTAYFFDGHGQRVKFLQTTSGFTVSSLTLETDIMRLNILQKNLTGFKNMQKLVMGVITVIFGVLLVLGFIFFNVIMKVLDRIAKSFDFTHQSK